MCMGGGVSLCMRVCVHVCAHACMPLCGCEPLPVCTYVRVSVLP